MSVRDHARSIVGDARWRRLGYLVIALVLAVLCIVPRPYVARAKLLPQDSSSAGLGQIVNSLGGTLSNFANLLTGGRAPNDLYLIIGRSDSVSGEVIRSMNLVGPDRLYATIDQAKIDLKKRVDVHLLLGGVVEIETVAHDPRMSLELTQAYTRAISDRIGLLTRNTTRRKGEIVAQRFRDSRQRVAETEQALDAFRRANRLASPEIQLGSEISIRTNLQAQLAAKQVELQSLQQTAGPENPELQTVRAQIAELRAQIASSNRSTLGSAGPSVGGLTAITSRYQNLFRDARFAQALYEVYARATEQVAVESLVAESATFIQIVESPNVDPQRHYNIWAVALLAMVIGLALVTEVYVPLTGLQWRELFGRIDTDDRT